MLFRSIWKYFMGSTHKEYWSGLLVVPILMLSKIFLGIYYNLSVWYKVTNKNLIGARITITGVVVTVIINFFLIPYWGYWACATAAVCCYGWMMIVSAIRGQKYYPVPYPWVKIILYVAISIGLFFFYYFLRGFILSGWTLHLASLGLCLIFLLVVLFTEKEEFRRFPVIGRFFQR